MTTNAWLDGSVEVANGANGTYYYYFNMDENEKFSLQYYLHGGTGGGGSGLTMTLEGTTEPDAETTYSDLTYADITNLLFGVASVAVADTVSTSGHLIDDVGTSAGFFKLRIKLVAAPGDTGTADWKLYLKKW